MLVLFSHYEDKNTIAVEASQIYYYPKDQMMVLESLNNEENIVGYTIKIDRDNYERAIEKLYENNKVDLRNFLGCSGEDRYELFNENSEHKMNLGKHRTLINGVPKDGLVKRRTLINGVPKDDLD